MYYNTCCTFLRFVTCILHVSAQVFNAKIYINLFMDRLQTKLSNMKKLSGMYIFFTNNIDKETRSLQYPFSCTYPVYAQCLHILSVLI